MPGWLLGLVIVAACSGGAGSEMSDSDANGALANQTAAATVSAAGTAGMGALPGAASGKGPAAASGSRTNPAAVSGAAGQPGSNAPAASGTNSPTGSNGSAASGSAAASGNAAAASGAPTSGSGASGSMASGSNAAGGTAATGSAAGSGGSAQPAGMAGTAATSGAEPASCQGDQPGNAPVIYVIGDSTASVYEEKLYPRMGWAQPLQEYFKKTCATVQDKALSGRSSKSFFDEGAWTPIRSALHEGDFVLIQFGHNDEKSDDPARYTEPFGSYQKQLTVYIDDTLAAKATPILLTSIERNKWSSGKLSATHGDYPEAVRQLAQKRQLALVDMTQLTHEYLERIGQPAANKLYLNLAPGESPNYPNGNSDDTHLQDKGAHTFAEIALADFARQRSALAALLDHVPAAP